MKRVLLVTDFFRPEPGGLEGLFTGIMRHWEVGRMEVVVATGEAHYITPKDDLKLFDSNEAYPVFRNTPRPAALRHYFKGNREQNFENFVRERIEQFEPEHILLGQVSESSRLARFALAEFNLDYSIFLNGRDFKNRLGFFNFKDRQLVLKARNVFTLSRYLARGAREFGIQEDRITVLPPGIEVRWAENIQKRSRKRPLPDFLAQRVKGKVTLIGLGPLIPLKGFDLAIEAIHALQDLHKKIHLLLVGSGPEFSYLNELIRIRGLEHQVTLTGFLEDDVLARLMEHADIFLQPGADREDDVESLGTGLMEAAWFGLPSLVGKIGGAPEIVRHGISGYVIEPGNLNELSTRIRELASTPRLRQRMGKTAGEIAHSEFDMTRTCEAIATRI